LAKSLGIAEATVKKPTYGHQENPGAGSLNSVYRLTNKNIMDALIANAELDLLVTGDAVGSPA
jgi:hypothetical protein